MLHYRTELRATIYKSLERPGTIVPNRESAIKKFGRMGIDVSKPGFYDTPIFVEAERNERYIRETYADFVNGMPLSERYRADARNKVGELCEFISKRLPADPRGERLSLQIASVMSRILDKEGIWNYIVRGAFSVQSRTDAVAYVRPFKTFSVKPAPDHAWLCVPPFKIVDVLGNVPRDTNRVCVLEEAPAPATVDLTDLVEPEYRREFEKSAGRNLDLRELERLKPRYFISMRRYGIYQIRKRDLLLKYTSCVIEVARSLEQCQPLVKEAELISELYELWKAT